MIEENPPILNAPRVVILTVGSFVLIHGIRALLPAETDYVFLLTLAFVPARYTGLITDIPGYGVSEVTSFVTYMFVHGDLTHLAVNSLWLLAFGTAIARRVGGVNFLLFSLLCGVAGALTHLMMHWGDLAPVVGASAAISGQMAGAVRFMFGAYKNGKLWMIKDHPRSTPLASVRESLSDPRILIFLGIWIALNLLFGLGAIGLSEGTAVAWEAHIGGFACGLFTFGFFDRKTTAAQSKGST